jgi:hypothetical protein
MAFIFGLIIGFALGWAFRHFRVWPWYEAQGTDCQRRLAAVRLEVRNLEQTLGG